MSEQGSTLNTAVTVGDIYGENSYLNLESDMIASFFAKLSTDETKPSDADILKVVLRLFLSFKGLLVMITNNIAQIAFINAQKEGISNIFFAGNFLRGNAAGMKALAEGIAFWSGGTMRALFLRHEGMEGEGVMFVGYFGCLGGLLGGKDV